MRSEQPLSSVLLADVEQFQINVLNPNELERWPSDNANDINQLPAGLKIKVMIRDVEYEWIFNLLNTDFLNKSS